MDPLAELELTLERAVVRYETANPSHDIASQIGPINFACKGPGIWWLTGANGSGKTTILRLIAGVLLPAEGNVRIVAKDGCAYLPASTGFFSEWTLAQNLRFFARQQNETNNERLAWLTTELELDTLLEKKAKTLSTGQKQRAAIARTLLPKRGIYILDEPFRGLDPKNRQLVAQCFARLSQNEMIILASPEPIDPELARILNAREVEICDVRTGNA